MIVVWTHREGRFIAGNDIGSSIIIWDTEFRVPEDRGILNIKAEEMKFTIDANEKDDIVVDYMDFDFTANDTVFDFIADEKL